MNIQLVESLGQIILSLSSEESVLLEEWLEQKTNWRKSLQRIREHRTAIYVERGGKSFDPPVEEVIQQMREERTEELMRAYVPDSKAK